MGLRFGLRLDMAKAMALVACGGLAALYVGVLYVPSLLLRLRPKSQRQLLLQRFACATFASIVATASCLLLLPVKGKETSSSAGILRLFGLRSDHMVQATCFPLFLTALLYLGPLFVEALEAIEEEVFPRGSKAAGCFKTDLMSFILNILHMAEDVFAWRNYVVAPLSEEIVFRSCMVPLLLCGGYSAYAAIFICPMFFSIAHVHRFWELIHHEKYSRKRALLIVGAQLGYTVVFGWYAAFLFLRTGHLVAAIVPHIFCNIMGFPNLIRAVQSRVLAVIYILGFISFLGLLGPLSSPALYNNDVKHCKCWQGFCRV